MGIIQIIAGLLKLGRFIRMVPYPVMLGFVNGLAVVIFLSQLQHLKVVDTLGNQSWMIGASLYIMLSLIDLTMVIAAFLPKLTKAFPSTLASIAITSLVVKLIPQW